MLGDLKNKITQRIGQLKTGAETFAMTYPKAAGMGVAGKIGKGVANFQRIARIKKMMEGFTKGETKGVKVTPVPTKQTNGVESDINALMQRNSKLQNVFKGKK